MYYNGTESKVKKKGKQKTEITRTKQSDHLIFPITHNTAHAQEFWKTTHRDLTITYIASRHVRGHSRKVTYFPVNRISCRLVLGN
jgi:hypothetical protein